ncbi:response regulator [Hydrogenovibrio sp. 3SP14C1]|uniref:response regulator n=1 Tax=Hydrogenovibrio sp. 3SP14C1 TaxID=3038774 RepID=UPI002415E757|nr:response regulator [Hydrogenovibrio sp. 3SP14C1]MDG4811705.1 response regulator [Hydrogenovibrio sp. 3SP14C1]
MASVLLVDDDQSLRAMLSFSLKGSGYTVYEANSTVDAIALLKEQVVDVMILDMGMPPNEHAATEGLRLLEWVSDQMLNTKIIVLTGQSADETSYLSIKYGAFDFLTKPVEYDVLKRSIDRALLFLKQSQKLKEQEGVQKVELDLEMGNGVKAARNAAELKILKQVLSDTEFNIHEVARRLGLKRENVYYLINKYGIERS